MKQIKRCSFVTALVFAWSFFSSTAHAAVPTISSVSGTVQTGQTLTVTGTTMVDHNTAGWDTSAAWNFEGANYSADGYSWLDGQPATCSVTYDNNIKLMGSKSIKFRQHGAFSGISAGACSVYSTPTIGNDFYVSGYVRYDPSAGNNQWPNNFLKLFLTVAGSGSEFYFQPRMNNGNSPVQWEVRDGAVEYNPYIPGGALKNGRWYYVEGRWKNSSPKRIQAWIDGVEVTNEAGQATVLLQYMVFGLVNMSATTSSFDMTLNIDRFVVSSSRIYPASMIEIGNSPTYGQGTKLWQEPLYLSDGSIQIKADLTGLGSGPYYLWVTNNRQERSVAYALSGGMSPDTTPPTLPSNFNLAANATSQSSITVSWNPATDDVGVSNYQVERCTGLSCSTFTQVGTPTASPFVDAGLSASTGYSYHVRAVDAAGNASDWSNVIGATTQSAIPAPTFTISANPTSIVSGQSSTLTWSTVTNATSCTASGGTFTGSESTSGGTQGVSPTATTTYMLSCTGTGGTTNQSATVTVTSGSSTLFFSEGYEDTNFSSRGWYDTTTGTVDAVEHHSGTSSLRCTYSASGNNCIAPSRHKFTESNGVYVSYWVKYSSNFVGSGKSYHPHEFLLLTNLNGDYDGLAFDYLTAYLESHWDSSSNGYIQAAFQDGQNIDQTKINQNLIGVTENRAVAGCNGSPSGYTGDCYNRGDGIYVNGTTLSSSQTFTSANKNGWNHVEAYYQLNTISSNMGQSDGIIRVWFNDALVLERTNAILRTAQRPTMKFNQFVFGPWIGDGSPVTQTMWIDDLEVRDSRPSTTSPTFSSCSTVTPTNFTDPTFTGYGAPYDLFASNTSLMATECTVSDATTLKATLGITGDTTRIVYTTGYYYDPGISDWAPFTGTCTGALNGEWCRGSVSTSITDTDISTANASDPAYIVGMTCSMQGGSWKCGCRDTTCSNFYWMVQGAGR